MLASRFFPSPLPSRARNLLAVILSGASPLAAVSGHFRHLPSLKMGSP
jgi:hypothetical protein